MGTHDEKYYRNGDTQVTYPGLSLQIQRNHFFDLRPRLLFTQSPIHKTRPPSIRTRAIKIQEASSSFIGLDPYKLAGDLLIGHSVRKICHRRISLRMSWRVEHEARKTRIRVLEVTKAFPTSEVISGFCRASFEAGCAVSKMLGKTAVSTVGKSRTVRGHTLN